MVQQELSHKLPLDGRILLSREEIAGERQDTANCHSLRSRHCVGSFRWHYDPARRGLNIQCMQRQLRFREVNRPAQSPKLAGSKQKGAV